MTGPASGRQATEELLIMLRGELASRRVNCDLRHDGGQLSLAVYRPGAGAAASDLFDRVIVTRFRGQWWYARPEVEPVCAAIPVTRAVQTIISELILGDADRAGVADITDLAVWQKLRQAAQDVLRPNTSRPAATDLGPGPGLPPDSTCRPSVIESAEALSALPGDHSGHRLGVMAAELAIVGFQVDVVDSRSDGCPSVLAITSPLTGARAEVTAARHRT